MTVDFGEEGQEGQKVTVSRDVYDEISVGDSINVVVYYDNSNELKEKK